MIATPWIRTYCDSGVVRCERCGCEYRYAMPVPLNLFITACRQFLRDHRKCKERKA